MVADTWNLLAGILCELLTNLTDTYAKIAYSVGCFHNNIITLLRIFDIIIHYQAMIDMNTDKIKT